MSVHRSVRATLFVAVITALLFVVVAYSSATSKADAQSASIAPAAKTDQDAAEATRIATAVPCGFSFRYQTWRNCKNYRYRVYITYHDSIFNRWGNAIRCVSPGTHTAIELVGPYRLMYHAYKGGRC